MLVYRPLIFLSAMLPMVYSGARRSIITMRASSKKGTVSSSSSGEFRALAPLYSPRGANQRQYVQYLDDPAVSILLGVGPAGTGKTLFACSAAVQEMRRGSVQKIILTRPVVSVEEDIGFLPGSLINKMDPWTRPIFDILGEFYSKKDIDAMLVSGALEISPLAYMRGRTFKRAFVIADEMQNSSPNQMLMLATRLGQGSKMVITGDLKQSDRMIDNGLADLMAKLSAYRGDLETIRMVEMSVQDVERSEAVAKILDIYGDTGAKALKPMKFSYVPPVAELDRTLTVTSTTNCVIGSHSKLKDIRQPIGTDYSTELGQYEKGIVQDTKYNDCALIPNDPLRKR